MLLLQMHRYFCGKKCDKLLTFFQTKNKSVYIFVFCSLHFLGLIFLILSLQIFFQNIKVGGGKKIKITITKKKFFI